MAKRLLITMVVVACVLLYAAASTTTTSSTKAGTTTSSTKAGTTTTSTKAGTTTTTSSTKAGTTTTSSTKAGTTTTSTTKAGTTTTTTGTTKAATTTTTTGSTTGSGLVCNVANSGGGDDTSNIVAAFTSCATSGTIVFASATYNWNTPGTTLPTLKSTTVNFGTAKIVFPATTSFKSVGYYVTLSGTDVNLNGGTFDGNGQAYWNSGTTGGPKILKLGFKGTSKITGLTVTNSPAQHITVSNCQGCIFDKITITVDTSRLTSGNTAKNTDGFDISSSSNTQILNAVINNGDDCIAMNGGSLGLYNLYINNLQCSNGHGVSIGSLGKSDASDIVSGVYVSGSTFTSTKYAARIKTFLVSSSNTGYANNITYTGITVVNPTSSPICVTQAYCDSGNCGSGTVAFNLQAAKFTNFVFTGVKTTTDVVDLYCESTSKCGPFTFSGVTIPSGGKVGCNDVGSSQISGLTCSTTTIATAPCN